MKDRGVNNAVICVAEPFKDTEYVCIFTKARLNGGVLLQIQGDSGGFQEVSLSVKNLETFKKLLAKY
jgi:hypothetical protein